MRKILALVAVGLVLALSPVAAQDSKVDDGPPQGFVGPPTFTAVTPPRHVDAPSTLGTIQYDTGVFSGTPGNPVDFMWGNQFNTQGTGAPVLPSGSVATVTVYMGTVGGSLAYLSMFGPVNGTTAPKLISTNLPMAAGFNTLIVPGGPIGYGGPSFLAGIWFNAPGGDAVGLDTNASPAGFHGAVIDDNFPNPTGTGFQAVTFLNAIVRVQGNVLPVELMEFSVSP